MDREKERQREILEWRRNQIQLRRWYADTPAGFQDKETEISAVSQWEADWYVWKEQQRYRLAESPFSVSEPFSGRERELRQISEAIDRHNPKPVFLYGIGGIGKSALAREWIRRNQGNYRHIVELNGHGNICDTICSDELLPITHLHYEKEQYGSKKQYFRRKLELLRDLVRKESTLLFLDGSNEIEDKNREEVFSLPCDMIVTTRIHPALWGYTGGIAVQALKDEKEWRRFLELYFGVLSEEEFQHFQRMRERFGGHTLRLMFALREMRGERVEEEIRKFEASLLQELPLKRKEKDILCCMSLFPGQRIPKDLFHRIIVCPEKTLQRLSYFLLVFDQGEELFLHPVASEAVQHLLSPGSSSCGRMIRRLAEYAQSRTWRFAEEENRWLEAYVRALLQAFPNPAAYLSEAFGNLCVFLWGQGYRQEAESYLLHILESVKNHYGERHQATGQMVLRMGELFWLEGQEKKAEEWYREGAEILWNSPSANRNYCQCLSFACIRMARCFRKRENWKEAKTYQEMACGYLKRYRVLPEDTDVFFWLKQSIALERIWLCKQEGLAEEAEKLRCRCEKGIKQRFGERFCWRELCEVLKFSLLTEDK